VQKTASLRLRVIDLLAVTAIQSGLIIHHVVLLNFVVRFITATSARRAGKSCCGVAAADLVRVTSTRHATGAEKRFVRIARQTLTIQTAQQISVRTVAITGLPVKRLNHQKTHRRQLRFTALLARMGIFRCVTKASRGAGIAEHMIRILKARRVISFQMLMRGGEAIRIKPAGRQCRTCIAT
jgi:hypothetical protein